MLADLACAFMLLTRLPVGWLAKGRAGDALADAVWAYPVVGLVVGAIGGAVFLAAAWIGMPPSLGAVCALAAMLLATGGLHEDGLADTADGFGGGATRARKLEIMRDSRIGSFGALALLLALAFRGAAIVAIAPPGRAAVALVVAGALGRAAMIVPIVLLAPARADGLGAGLRGRTRARAWLGLALGCAVALLHPGAIVAALLAALAMTELARRQIGGYTGDALGATAVAAECAVLGLIASG